MIERLPTPWGLVRLGVAPDHPNIKAVSRAFEKIAPQPGFRFFGNVEVGRDVTHDELAAALRRGRLRGRRADRPAAWASPARTCPGSWPATDVRRLVQRPPRLPGRCAFDLSRRARGRDRERQRRGRRRADARARPHEELAPTDTTDAAIEAIVGSRHPRDRDARPPRPGAGGVHDARAEGARRARGRRRDRRPGRPRARPGERGRARRRPRRRSRNVEVLREYAAREPAGKPRRLVLRFLVSPVAILGDGRVEAVEVVRNELVADERRAAPRRADRRARDDPVPDRPPQRRLPRRRAPGRPVRRAPRHDPERRRPRRRRARRAVPGLYCAGWIKRGPSGVIGTNKKDATETVELLLEDAARRRCSRAGATASSTRCSPSAASSFVEYAGWAAIDEHERAARRAARPPARQALHAGTSCSRGARG